MQVGDPIILSCVLFDAAEDRYVRATLYADDEVWGSAINLSHVANGVYFYMDEDNLVFPSDKFEVKAVYEVFADAGFTILDPGYQRSEEIFRLNNEVNSDIMARLNQIVTIVTAYNGADALEGEIEED